VSDVGDLRPEAIWCEAWSWNMQSAEREDDIYRAIEKQALYSAPAICQDSNSKKRKISLPATD